MTYGCEVIKLTMFVQSADEAANFENVLYTQQCLPYNKNSIMKLNSSSDTQKRQLRKSRRSSIRSTTNMELLDYLHLNILYCGGIYHCVMQYYILALKVIQKGNYRKALIFRRLYILRINGKIRFREKYFAKTC